MNNVLLLMYSNSCDIYIIGFEVFLFLEIYNILKYYTFVVSVFPVPAGPSGAPFKFRWKAPTNVR